MIKRNHKLLSLIFFFAIFLFADVFMVISFALPARASFYHTASECLTLATSIGTDCAKAAATESSTGVELKVSLCSNTLYEYIPGCNTELNLIWSGAARSFVYYGEYNSKTLAAFSNTEKGYFTGISGNQMIDATKHGLFTETACINSGFSWSNGLCTRTAPGSCTSCTSDQYCNSSSVCVAKKTDGATGCADANQCSGGFCNSGTCASSAPNNDACTTDANCNNESKYCNTTASPNTCDDKKAQGVECTTANECTSAVCTNSRCAISTAKPCTDIVNNTDCPTGSYCSTTKFCATKKTNGTDCNQDWYCQSGLCGNENTCIPKRANGENCENYANRGCISGYCDLNTRLCGESCSGSVCSCRSDVDCGTEKYCTTTKICKDKKTATYACELASECISGICKNGFCSCSVMADDSCATNQFCNGATGACVAKTIVGSPCDDPIQCKSGDCTNSKCGCVLATDCDSGKYCLTETKVCTGKLGTGDPCSKSEQCPSENCANSDGCSSDTCTSKVCVADSTKSCISNSDCNRDTQFCNKDLEPVCSRKRDNGQGCASDYECSSDRCNTVCMAGKTNGTACEEDDECDSKWCSTDNDKCAPYPCMSGHIENCPNQITCGKYGGSWWPSDNKCHDSGDPSSCPTHPCADATEFCDAGSCKEKLALDAACDNPSQCYSGYCSNDVCLAEPSEDSLKCDPECADTQYCWEKTCTPKKPDGEACSANEHCTNGKCEGDNSTCGLSTSGAGISAVCPTPCKDTEWCDSSVPICKPKSADNAVCTAADQCTSNFCSAEKKCTAKPADAGGGGSGTTATPGTFDLPNFLGLDDPSLLIGRIIKTIMGFVGTIALVIFMYGGFLWLTSAGDDKKVTSGKNAMIWSAVGLVITFAGYILVKFVFSLFGK